MSENFYETIMVSAKNKVHLKKFLATDKQHNTR